MNKKIGLLIFVAAFGLTTVTAQTAIASFIQASVVSFAAIIA